MDAVQINLERLLPQFVAEQWTAAHFAEVAGVHHTTISNFLEQKREEIRIASMTKIVGVTDRMWNALVERAMIDRDELERMNSDQRKGKPVNDKLVSSVVKRIIAIVNIGKSLGPRSDTPMPLPNERHVLINDSASV